MKIFFKFKEVFKSFQKKNIDILIALLPLTLFSVILFGIKAILVCLVCIASACIFDYLIGLILKNDKFDYSKSLVSGLLFGLTLPPALPLYIAVLGSAFSAFVVKLFFTSKDGFIISPALTSRIFLQLSFPTQMSFYLEPMSDVKASATPLTDNIYSLKEISFGVISGSIGETASILIILCGLYLMWVKVISWQIPLSLILSALVSILIFTNSSVITIFLGGLLFASFFLSVEGVILPKSMLGKIIYGSGCGFLTVIIREFSNIPEGVSYAIVFMCLIVPLIDKVKFSLKRAVKDNEI